MSGTLGRERKSWRAHAMPLRHVTCFTCGLRITITAVGWTHLGTAAGRKADRDHAATPLRGTLSTPTEETP